MLEIILAGLTGLVVGGVLNALADDLPYRRTPGLPTYPDGTPRPFSAWWGITAFITGQRTPRSSQPSDARRRVLEETEPKLGWRYPLTEISTAILMMLAVHGARVFPNVSTIQMLFYMIYVAFLVLITVVDVEHRLILYVETIPFGILAVIDAIFLPYPPPDLQDALAGGALGFAVFFLLYLGGFLFTYIVGLSRGQAINTTAFGYGDVMLMTVSGFLLGFAHVILAMFITVFLGAFAAFIVIVLRTFIGRRYQMFTAIPYGPYIVIATYLMLFYSIPIRQALIGY